MAQSVQQKRWSDAIDHLVAARAREPDLQARQMADTAIDAARDAHRCSEARENRQQIKEARQHG